MQIDKPYLLGERAKLMKQLDQQIEATNVTTGAIAACNSLIARLDTPEPVQVSIDAKPVPAERIGEPVEEVDKAPVAEEASPMAVLVTAMAEPVTAEPADCAESAS